MHHGGSPTPQRRWGKAAPGHGGSPTSRGRWGEAATPTCSPAEQDLPVEMGKIKKMDIEKRANRI
jgi:hypothetical protein